MWQLFYFPKTLHTLGRMDNDNSPVGLFQPGYVSPYAGDGAGPFYEAHHYYNQPDSGSVNKTNL